MNNLIKYLAIAIVLFSTNIIGQTYDLQFVEIQNDKTVSGNYDVKIQIKSASVFKMASSSITFNFNDAGLSSPTLLTAHNFLPLSYVSMTVTNPQTDVASINIVYPQTDDQYATDVPITWLDVATVRFTIDNINETTQLAFRAAIPSNTVVYSCAGDGAGFTTTLLLAGAWTGSDVPLPVELAEFTATDGVNGVELNWTTESELENLGFQLEKRIEDTEGWNLVTSYKADETLKGQGTVPYPTDYTYLDNLVENGKEYEYRLSDIDYNGLVTYHATRFVIVSKLSVQVIPEEFALHAAYPNPFNPYTNISFDIPEATNVKINIYNQLGQLVRSLHNAELDPGQHSIVWDARNNSGQTLGAGIYIYQIEAGAISKTQKMILLK